MSEKTRLTLKELTHRIHRKMCYQDTRGERFDKYLPQLIHIIDLDMDKAAEVLQIADYHVKVIICGWTGERLLQIWNNTLWNHTRYAYAWTHVLYLEYNDDRLIGIRSIPVRE